MTELYPGMAGKEHAAGKVREVDLNSLRVKELFLIVFLTVSQTNFLSLFACLVVLQML